MIFRASDKIVAKSGVANFETHQIEKKSRRFSQVFPDGTWPQSIFGIKLKPKKFEFSSPNFPFEINEKYFSSIHYPSKIKG